MPDIAVGDPSAGFAIGTDGFAVGAYGLTRSYLLEPSSRLIFLVHGHYLDDAGAEQEIWASTGGQGGRVGWVTEPTDDPPNLASIGAVDFALSLTHSVDPEQPGEAVPQWGGLEFSNLAESLPGFPLFDAWRKYSVDGRRWTIYAVGYLADGTVVNLADTVDSPVFDGVGAGAPRVSDEKMVIVLRDDRHKLDQAMQPLTYSPPSLVFPGTSVGCVNFGDVGDETGSFSREYWIYSDNPELPGQVIDSKDGTTTGWSVDLGTAGVGRIRFRVPGQAVANTDSPAGSIRPRRWYLVSVVCNLGTGTRSIYIDRTLVVITSSVTGAPTANSTDRLIGKNFLGRISEVRSWLGARALVDIENNMLVPLSGSESNLEEYFPFTEGVGPTTASKRVGSTVVGTLGAGVSWGSSEWQLAALAGEYRPVLLGRHHNVPLKIVDPLKQILQAPTPLNWLGVVRSSGEPLNPPTDVSPGYTVDYARGLITILDATAGTYSCDMLGDTPWGTAIHFDGVSGTASTSYAAPAGAMALSIMTMADDESAAERFIGGWRNGSAAGGRYLHFGATGTNRPSFTVTNDAGTAFSATSAGSLKGDRRYVITGVLDPDGLTDTAALLLLYVDGVEVARTVISGAWTSTLGTLRLARNPTSGGTDWLAGTLDEVLLANRALLPEEILELAAAPATGSEDWLDSGWHCDEKTGTTALNIVGAGAALTLAGTCEFVPGRHCPADLLRLLYVSYGGFAPTDLLTSSFATLAVQQPGNSGWYVANGEKASDVATRIAGGIGAVHGPNLNGDVRARRFDAPTGSATTVYEGGRALRNEPLEPDAQAPSPIYRVRLAYDANDTKIAEENVAQSLRTTDPAFFTYASRDYLTIDRQDFSLIRKADGSPGPFPQARTLGESTPVLTPLIDEVDAIAEAERLLAIFKNQPVPLTLPFFAQPFDFDLFSEFCLVWADRLGLDAVDGFFVAVALHIEDDQVDVTGWRTA